MEGGANALNDYAWDHLAKLGDDHAVLPADIPSFKEQRKPTIISTTNPDEFLNYGWLHGLTVTLPVFLSGADAIAEALHGKTVLITAAESHYSGDTWILLDMLRARGVDAYFMQPTREELLIKPAYFKAYKNADRYFGAAQSFDYVLGYQDVRFLDFQSADDWARTKNQLPRTDHIDMEIVAKGGLTQAIAGLDQSKAYVGLAYDRRTFYHPSLRAKSCRQAELDGSVSTQSPASSIERCLLTTISSTRKRRCTQVSRAEASELLEACSVWFLDQLHGLFS